MVLGQRHHARCSSASAHAPFALAGTERQYERSRPFDIRHLGLDLTLDFDAKSLRGTATLDFSRVATDAAELVLDARAFGLERVRLDRGRGLAPATYTYDGERITIRIPRKTDSGTVEIRYAATPRRGMYFLAPDRQVRDRPKQVWTQCQDEDARHWVPCHDKPHVKMTTALKVRVPAGFVALSNGDLVNVSRPKGKAKSWTYDFRLDQPHPSYLLTLVAGEFEVLEDRDAKVGTDDERDIPIRYYVPKARTGDGWRAFDQTPRMVELFSRLTGVPYPWSRYSQIVVSDFIFGGMENTTATTMYEHILLDEKAAIDIESHDLVAHELAHQWFGDFVTCRDWSHAWLNEGFATFFEHVEREDRLGRDEYDYSVEGDLEAYLDETAGRYTRSIVCHDYEEPIDLFDRHLYEKGGLVLHMLRRALGDETFWKGVRLYLESHAYGIVETNDLARALERVSGRSLEQFFDQWVYRPGHPVLKVKMSYEKELLTVGVRQTQKKGDVPVFSFPFEVAVADKAGKVRRHEKSVTAAADTLVIACAERPAWVQFDPDLRVIGRCSVETPTDMLRNMLRDGDTARARWSAASSLGKKDDPISIAALGKALGNQREKWMVRAEAAHSLGRIRAEECLPLLTAAAKDEHPRVRRAVAVALGSFRQEGAARALMTLARRDPSHLVAASSARALGRTRQPSSFEVLVKLLDVPSWADVRRAGVLDGLANLRDDRALGPVMDRTRYGIPTRGRRAAIAALPRLGDTRRVREHLEDLLEDRDPHLRLDAVRALQALGDPKGRPALRRQLERDLDGRVLRRIREALSDLTDRGSAEHRRLRDELETVRGELTEMRTRIAKVEAGAKARKDGEGSAESPRKGKPTATAKKPKKKGSKKSKRRRSKRVTPHKSVRR